MVTAAPDGAIRAGRYRWYALSLLTAAYAWHSLDRQILAVIVEPVKREFGATDTAIGALGFAYAAAFSAACLPVGWLVDRLPRRRLFAAILAAWSLLTIVCGFVRTYSALAAARMGVGAAEAGAQPVCVSLISDLFGPRERSTAIGLFYLGPALGLVASFLVGGAVASSFGWRAAFWVAGLPGAALAVILLSTFREPVRGALDAGRAFPAPFRDFVAHARSSPVFLRIALGMTFTSLTVTAMWLWVTSLLIRNHGLPLQKAAVVVALGATASAMGSAALGRLADRFARGAPDRLLLVPVLGTAACVPSGALLAYAPTLAWALAALVVTAFAMGAYLGPCTAVVMAIVPPGMRGQAAAALQLLINLLGAGLGPLLVGSLSDLFGGPQSLRPAFATTMALNAIASAVLCSAMLRMKSARGRPEDTEAPRTGSPDCVTED